MAERQRLVLDANILIRACLGIRVRQLIADSAGAVDFFVAEANAAEASGYIEVLAARRGLNPEDNSLAGNRESLEFSQSRSQWIPKPISRLTYWPCCVNTAALSICAIWCYWRG